MKIEIINNKFIMNVGLINVNYKLDPQIEAIKPKVDALIYFDNDDLFEILDYIRNDDALIIQTYSFINDETVKSLKFKEQLDQRGIIIHSILENTLEISSAAGKLIFNLSIEMYKFAEFILENRLHIKTAV